MNKKGFTLVEILVVLGIIGLLGILATVMLSSARVRSRDAKRLSDMARVQTALELYFNDHNSYPLQTDAAALGQAATACLSSSGFSPICDASSESVYLSAVPSTPSSGLKELVECSGKVNAYCYVGTAAAYRIQFELETDNPEAKLKKGVNCSSESGVEAGACASIE